MDDETERAIIKDLSEMEGVITYEDALMIVAKKYIIHPALAGLIWGKREEIWGRDE